MLSQIIGPPPLPINWEKIGQGGMGEVYRAEDTHLSRKVAITVLPEQFTIDSSVTERSLTGERRRVRPEMRRTRLPSGPRPLGGPYLDDAPAEVGVR